MNNKTKAQMWADWILRIILAIVFISAGYSKIASGVENFATAMNIPIYLGWAAAIGELGSGICIFLAGFLKSKFGDAVTRLSGFLIAFIMVVAFFMAKLKGFDAGFLKGLEGSFNVIPFFGLGLFYLLSGNN